MKKSAKVLFIILIAFNLSSLFADDPLVRVRIMYTEDTIKMNTDSKIYVYAQNDKRIILRGDREFSIVLEDDLLNLIDDKDRVLITGTSLEINNTESNKPMGIKHVPYGIGWFWEGAEDRVYKGDLEFYVNKDHKIDVISVLDIETYLLGVVPSEI